MAILNAHPKGPEGYKSGDAVTAKVVNDTIDTAVAAHNRLEEVLRCAGQALSEAHSVKDRADKGMFNGTSAALVEAQGMFGFSVVDGNLILSYTGTVTPAASINADGELILSV